MEIGNANFTLTFPAGWAKLSLGTSDSVLISVMKGADGGVFLQGVPHVGALTQAQISAFAKTYGGNDSIIVTDQGDKTFGGKAFTMIEFKKANPSDTAEAKQRIRIYYLSQGNFLFQAITVYDAGSDNGVLADLESALATLTITASAGVRNVAALQSPETIRPDHDILGRMQAGEIRRTPLFRVPAL